MKGKMPDITQAQVLAAIQWVVAQAVAWGYVNNAMGQKIISFSSSLIGLGLMLADAHLRGKRNEAHATVEAAKIVGGATGPLPPQP